MCLFLFLVINTSMVPGNDTQNSGFLLQGWSVEPELQPFIFWNVPLHVSDHFVWKSAHHPGCQFRLPSSHSHVLLHLQLVLCWHLFHYHNHPKDVNKYTDPEQSYILWRGASPRCIFTYCLWHWMIFFLTVMAYDLFLAICHPCTTQSSWTPWLLWTAGAGVLGSLVPCSPC